MTTDDDNNCWMEARIIKLETEQEMMKNDLSDYSDALRENTRSLQELKKIMVRHDEMLKTNDRSEATRNAVITGVIIGIVVFVVTELIHII